MDDERKAQTRATERYMNKVGTQAKTYKLRKKVVEDFAIACKGAGVSQSEALMELMQNYIDEQKNKICHDCHDKM